MNVLRMRKISHRVTAMLSVLIAAVMVLSTVSISSLSEANSRLEDMYNEEIGMVETVESIKAALYLIRGDALSYAMVNDPAVRNELKDTIDKLKARSELDFASFETFSLSEDETAYIAELKKNAVAYLGFITGTFLPQIDAGNETAAIAANSSEGNMFFARARQNANGLMEYSINRADTRMENSQRDYGSALWIMGGVIAFVIACAVFTVVALNRTVSKPIAQMTAVMLRLTDKDWSVDVPSRDRADEIGEMASAVEVFKTNGMENERLAAAQAEENRIKMARAQRLDELTSTFEMTSSELVEALSAAATEMESTAQSMSATAEQTRNQATTVASAAGQTSSNVQTVAASTEELSASIEDIARQVSDSAKIAASAVSEADKADEIVRSLSDGAEKIGVVVNLINEIAEKTNLLALNATIESARAGEAGRGFAVVASEVKELAGQTAKATDEISNQVSELQSSTSKVVEALRAIGTTIQSMNSISSSVSVAVEQQGAATQEIARSVQQAAQGTELVTSNIKDVTEAASGTGAASSQVLSAARELSVHSERLSKEVKDFLAGVKAA